MMGIALPGVSVVLFVVGNEPQDEQSVSRAGTVALPTRSGRNRLKATEEQGAAHLPATVTSADNRQRT